MLTLPCSSWQVFWEKTAGAVFPSVDFSYSPYLVMLRLADGLSHWPLLWAELCLRALGTEQAMQGFFVHPQDQGAGNSHL